MTPPSASPQQNPLLTDWTGPFGLPPFDSITPAHFRPAFDTALARHRGEIDAIAADPEPPSFDNTIVALEKSGRALDRVSNMFFVLTSADTGDEIEAVEREVSPLLARHANALYLNRALYARIADLYARRDALGLDAEQARVLDRYHTRFVRAGAALDKPAQDRLAAINERLATLGTQFGQNVLADEKSFALLLDESDLAGLPDFARDNARAAAEERGQPGKFAITLARSSCETFLQFSARRDLREKVFQAWIKRGENGGATDNRAIIAEMVQLRAERAKLIGFDTYAAYRLDDQMAKTPAAARGLLEEVWSRARAKAGVERDALQQMIAEEGGNFALAPHDWRYYAEKLRKAKYELDEAEIKPYFQLDKLRDAAFETAQRLFGLSFTAVDVPLYHADARAWEVKDASGGHVGLFIGDYFARSSKHSGAWMTSLRDQEKLIGDIRPIILNVCNFSKPAKAEPALLSFEDARTLFHEFGHALHGLLSNVTYPLLAGTAVSSDFVELPSQLYEHWLEVPETLRKYARHARTGEPMPQALIDRVAGHAHLQSGLRHGRIHRLRAGRSRPAWLERAGRARRRRIRAQGPRCATHAGGDRHAPPAAALPASVLRQQLCRGLLLLYVVGGAGRRRLRGLPGDRRRLRFRHRPAPARFHLQRRQSARPGGSLQSLPRPAADGRCAAQEARAR